METRCQKQHQKKSNAGLLAFAGVPIRCISLLATSRNKSLLAPRNICFWRVDVPAAFHKSNCLLSFIVCLIHGFCSGIHLPELQGQDPTLPDRRTQL